MAAAVLLLVRRVRTDLLAPFERMRSAAEQLANMQAASDVLWNCHAVLKLLRKLRAQTRACAATAATKGSKTCARFLLLCPPRTQCDPRRAGPR